MRLQHHFSTPTPTPTPKTPLLLIIGSILSSVTGFTSNPSLSFHVRSLDSSTNLQATWSNGQAIKEYQSFLATGKSEVELRPDISSVIVSSDDDCALADALLSLGLKNDKKDLVVRPEATSLPGEVDGNDSYPIYIAIPPTQLEGFLDGLSQAWMDRFDDFVFFSGRECGVIEPILRKRGMCREATTQVEVHGFTTPGKGRFPRDLSVKFGLDAQGEEKWSGETSVCGKWAGSVAERMENSFIRCRTGFYRDWRRWMWEMAAYDAVFNLVGAVRAEPTSHQQVALYYDDEAGDMLWEITNNLRGYLAVTLQYGFEDRIFEYAEKNGSEMMCNLSSDLYQFSFEPFEASKMVCNYLVFAQKSRNLLQGMELKDSVKTFEQDLNPKTRQGNLRCDGVI